MKHLALLFISMAVAFYSSAQTWEWHWGAQVGSVGEEERPRLAVDNNDNTILATTFRGGLILGPDTYESPNDEGRDIIVTKYDPEGDLLWSALFAGGGVANVQHAGDLLYDIATDDSDNVYIIGNIGPNAVAIGQDVGNADQAAFVAQITSSGELGWITLADENFLNDRLTCVEVGLDGNVYAAGYTGQEEDYYVFGGVSATGVGSFTDQETVLIQLSPNGEVQWAQGITGKEVRRMAFDQMDNIIISSFSSAGGPDDAGHYLTKLDLMTNQELWVRYAHSNSIGTGRSELGLHIKADGSIVQFMTTGTSAVLEYDDGMNSPGGNGNQRGMIWHIGADGVATSVHTMADQFISAFNQIEFTSFVALDDDTYFIVGDLYDHVDMAQGGTITADPDLFGLPGYDILVLKIDSQGAISEMATRTGTAFQDGHDMGLLSNGDVVVCGRFETSSHPAFGDGTTIFGDDALLSQGEEDVFVARVTTGIDPPTSIAVYDEEPGFQVYPNPTSGAIRVNTQGLSGPVWIRQFDLRGSLIAAERVGLDGEWRYILQGEPGSYLLELRTEDHPPQIIRVLKE